MKLTILFISRTKKIHTNTSIVSKRTFKASFQHADFSASADFYACVVFSANPHMNFHHNADC